MPWHDGEAKMHRLLRVPPQDNPTSAMLTPQASFMFQRAPLQAFGTLDTQSRPWVTLWGGSSGFSEPLGQGMVGTRTLVDSKYDPVVRALVGDAEKSAVAPLTHGADGKLIAGLAIDLMTRKRVKTAGRLVAAMLQEVQGQGENELVQTQDQLQIVTKIEQSLGNCPKYLNQYVIRPALVAPQLVADGPSLSVEGQDLIAKSDMFFLSTSTEDDMDVNHRGGPLGFVRIISASEIAYPEYSGNRLYQSLGNLQLNPKIGLAFPDYATGEVLYVTGTAEILAGKKAAELLPGSNLAVKISIQQSRFVRGGLAFRGEKKEQSPYNPRVWPLASEGNVRAGIFNSTTWPSSQIFARLMQKTLLSPTIARFTFSVSGPGVNYNAGQWVALDFKAELDVGYEHMRDEDPSSLNDDFVRTFTISSMPSSSSNTDREQEFDITIRKVGPVTSFLFNQNERAGLEVPILGIGGEFAVRQEKEQVIAPFVAGGVGITPLLALLPRLKLAPDRFRLFWALRVEDKGFMEDTFERHHELAVCTNVYLTGAQDGTNSLEEMESAGASVSRRRLTKSDLDKIEAETWYLCAGKGLSREVLSWLTGQNVVSEDFSY